MIGKLVGIGKMIILFVDQGFEYGFVCIFVFNLVGYDFYYYYQLVIDVGLNVYVVFLGMIEVGVDIFVGQILIILKVNSVNSLMLDIVGKNQVIMVLVDDVLCLGCVVIGFIIYLGLDMVLDMFEEIVEMCCEVVVKGVVIVVWFYLCGEVIIKDGEIVIDVVVYVVQIVVLIGVYIIKIKLLIDYLMLFEVKKVYEDKKIDIVM